VRLPNPGGGYRVIECLWGQHYRYQAAMLHNIHSPQCGDIIE